ncbi:MAG: hypothetical protein ACTHKK_03905, partial [Candidatus Nitrosocosmicus sp.]
MKFKQFLKTSLFLFSLVLLSSYFIPSVLSQPSVDVHNKHAKNIVVVKDPKIGLPLISNETTSPVKCLTGTELVAGKCLPNRLPVADAGSSQTVNSGDKVTLDGSKSFDPNKNKLTY